MRGKKYSRFVKCLALCLAGFFLLSTPCFALEFWKHGPSAVAARMQTDVIYSHAGGQDLKLDLYFPTNTAGARLPMVLYVHGVGWQLGNKEMLGLMPGPVELLRRHYLVVSIDYRLAPENKFPVMLEDAKCAVRFLRAHAQEFNLDPNRIGVMGDSAGGHLVALLGLTDARAGFEGAGWTNES